MYQLSNKMKVLKRNNEYEDVSFDKILNRIRKLSNGNEYLSKLNIDETIIAQKVVQGIYDGVKTSELDENASQVTISMYSKDPQYKILASRIVISNHHKNTLDTFTDKIELLYRYKQNNIHKPLINKSLYEYVKKNSYKINSAINYKNDYLFDYFGFKTLEKNYLYKCDKKIIERPQDMFMRVSLSIHRDNIDTAIKNYKLMSEHYFTHATPTLYNAGSCREQFASCFLLHMREDSISGIYDTLKDCALISKHAGGIGLSIHNIRAKDSYISGTNGISNGLVPMLKVFNDTARYVDQGGGKRNGSFAMYLEPWHADIFEFIELKKNHGNELERARDLFYALWIPDLFMKKVLDDDDWCLFCPNECPGLSDTYGEKFNKLYDNYVKNNKYRIRIKARKLWTAILTSQIEVGMPYILYKDHCNNKSNQKNLGTIKSSNLCTEIIEYTSPDETAVCNLASISLKKFIKYRDISNINCIIYTKENCVYCNLAKGLLNKKNIKYKCIDHSELDRKSLENKYPDKITLPQIYINNNHIGGFNELNKYLKPTYDYDKLSEITKQLTINLNNIIDYNYYPTPETKKSNMKHRPIGIGIQGLANVFFEFGYAFDSDEAKSLNENIFETIYYSSLNTSMNISKNREIKIKELFSLKEEYESSFGLETLDDYNINEYTEFPKIRDYKSEINLLEKSLLLIPEEINREKYLGSYSSFIDSPLQKGQFQFDLWDYKMTDSRHNWTELRENIIKYGVRNSLLVAPMPTASTAQILGNYECFEPILSNIYTRRVLSGEFMVINDYLVNDLISLNIWNKELKDKIILNDGSIQNIDEIPNHLKNIYKTVWEIKQKSIIDMAVDRGKFICQSQSMNLFLESPSMKTMSNMHLYSWKKGLKTGVYYLRSRPSSKAIQFTLNPTECENCSG